MCKSGFYKNETGEIIKLDSKTGKVIVQGINLDERAYERAMNSARELMSERDAVKELLK